MNLRSRAWLSMVLAITVAAPGAVLATNGYKMAGFGAKAQGMGGVGVAFPQDSIAAATNPAGMAFVGNRFDIGVEAFNPNRSAELAGTQEDSSRDWFLIPNFGYNMDVDGRLSIGVSVVGNGGMNTSYQRNLFDRAITAGAAQQGFFPPGTTSSGTPDTGLLGVNLAQILILPTLAYKLTNSQAIGIAPVVGMQRFRAYGLGNFQCFTRSAGTSNPGCRPPPQGFGALAPVFQPAPTSIGGLNTPFTASNSLTDQGNENNLGIGGRVGYLGRFVDDQVSVGLSYASKVHFEQFFKYKELFAEQGQFDIPAIIEAGFAFQPKFIPGLTLAFDYNRIFYGQIKALSNPGPSANQQNPCPNNQQTCFLGDDNGLGFGWTNQNVYKVGIAYDVSSALTVRAGYNHGKSPIRDSEILFNILAPATTEDHAAFGLTYKLSPTMEVTGAYFHAFNHKQSTDQTLLGPASIEMDQNGVDIGLGVKF